MKRFYILFFIGLIISDPVLGQKTLNMPVTNVQNSPGPDCDGLFSGDSDFWWGWENSGGGALGCEYKNECNCSNNWDPNADLFGGSYWSADCWPTGTYTVRFQGKENDDANCDHAHSYSRTDNFSFPLYSASAGNYAAASALSVSGNSDCGQTITYKYTSVWTVGGAFSGNNLNAGGYSVNPTCATAMDIDGGVETTGTLRTNDVNQCTNAWYIYDITSTNLSSITFNGANGNVTLYYSQTSSCSDLCSLASGSGGVSVKDPAPGRYYILISANGGRTNLLVSKVTGGPSNDNIRNAANMGAMPNAGGTLQLNAENNINSWYESGEPWINQNDEDKRTDWYSFTTGTTPPTIFNIGTEDNGSDDIDLDFKLYKLNDNSYVFPQCNVNWAKLSDNGDGDGGDNFVNVVSACLEVGSNNSYGTYNCLDANSKYYIQVKGFLNNAGWPCSDRNEDQGDYRVYVTGSKPYLPNDMVANATTIAISGVNNGTASSANAYNFCCGNETGEPTATSCSSVGTNKTVWYKFVANNYPLNRVLISTDNGVRDFDTEIQVWQSSDGSSTFSKFIDAGCNDDKSLINYASELDIDCLSPGATYYVQVDGNGNDVGNFRLDITTKTSASPLPSNDNICNATNIGGADQTLNLNTTETKLTNEKNDCATTELNEGTLGGASAGDRTVWYKFKTDATPPTYAEIDADGGLTNGNCTFLGVHLTFYPRVRVYKGQNISTACTGVPQLTALPDGETVAGVNVDADQTYFKVNCLEPNTWYYVQVYTGFGSLCSDGKFDIQLKGGPGRDDNDYICEAKTVTVQAQYTYNHFDLNNESNINATNCFEPNPDWTFETGQDNDHGVWYYLGQIPGRTVVVDANSSSGDNIDLQMALYSSSTPKGACVTPASSPSLTEIQKEYSGAGLIYDEDAYFNCLDPSKYYWLMIDGSAGPTSLITALEEGVFSIRFWDPEEGETTFCTAENLGAVQDGGSVTKLNLANKCGVNAVNSLGAPGTIAPSAFGLDNAVVYKFTTPPSIGYTDASVKIEATTNPYYPGQMGLLTGDEVDLQLAVYSSGACGSSHFVLGSNYDATNINAGLGSDESLIVNCLQPNTEYYLLVDGGGVNTSGYYDIKISDYGKHTPNDFLCNAISIPGTYAPAWSTCNYGTPTTLSGQNNYCASSTYDIPSSLGVKPPAWNAITSGVWYKFKAPKSGKVLIEGKNTISDLVPPYDEPEMSIAMAVFFLPGGFQGTCTANATEKDRLQYIASDYDQVFHDEDFTVDCLMPDSTYYLLVDGQSESSLLCPTCDRGEFYITITPDPRDRPSTNDLPCNAIDLGTPVMGSTIVDTKVSPAGGAASNPSPSTGYPGNTGLYNSARNSTGNCMRNENNFCAGISGEPAIAGGTFLTDFSPDATVWYSFTAPATGEVIIDAYSDPDSRGDQIDLQLAVYESSDGTCGGSLVPIKAEYNIGSFDETMRVQCLNPGQKYWILVDGSLLNTYGYFEVQVKAVAATLSGPANDDICNATSVTYPASIGTTTTLNNQTNRCATIQNVYPDPTTFTKDADVWYKFTTPNTAGPHAVEVTVTSGLPWPFGDAMDPQIALYKGSCPSSFTLVDDQYSAIGLPFYERMEFHCLEANTTYYLMVDGSAINEQGNFKLDVKRITPHPLAPNDNICSVVDAATGSLGTLGSVTGDKIGNTTKNWHNFCSSVEPGESALMTDGNYTLDQTVWFKFKTPNTPNNVDVEIRAQSDPNNVGDQIDLQMLLVQGNPNCPSSASTFTPLTPIESTDPAFTFNATLNVCLPPNTDFYVQVDGSGLNKQGYFTLEIENKGTSVAPSNDNACNAKTLPAGGVITGAYTGYLNDDNICATLEAGEPQHTAGGVQRSVWYKFVCPTSADVSIEVKGNSFIPFSTDYFLPDVTLWEINDGTGACTPFSKYADNWYQAIPNSLANGIYPTVVLTPLCLKPGYTYYVQVDGINGIGLDGYFDIRIKDNQPAYTGPVNNECAGATTLSMNSSSCQFSTGAWSTLNYGDPTWSRNPSGCSADCGDIWYKFTMPPACGNNTQSFVKIEGNDEMGLLGVTNSDLAIAAYRGNCSALSYIKCSTGGLSADPDFSITGTPGETIYLQVWDMNGDNHPNNFQLCVSEQKSADACSDATAMTLDVPYCWSVEASGPETPSSGVPGSGLLNCSGGNPEHSTYFKFTTDNSTSFCDDYYVYINAPGLAKDKTGSALQACLAGVTSSTTLKYSLWKVNSGGNLCTPGAANVSLTDCYSANDCGGGSINSNGVGPHGNGGVVDDTLWYNYGTSFQLDPNSTYYIVLDYHIDNIFYENSREVLDGTITVGRRCKGRVWEYTTAPLVTTSNYCQTRDGWQHYYDDKGTPSTADDRYVFSVFPNGNNIKGTAKVYLNNNYYSYLDIPNRFAEYVMRRRWDFVLTPGFNTIDPAKPVKVRFYYQNPEKQEIITAAQTFATNYGVFYEDFEWFKSENGHEFDVVNDVTPKVINVGPNGYSETGCLSFWNAAGNYVGPPGVQRCNVKTITDWDDDNVYHQWCNGVHFCEYNGLTGFSGGTGGTGDSPWDASPLPVTLISFVGYNDGVKNVLSWNTASEVNTLRFEVERSAFGSYFNYIGERPAAGNSSQVLAYNLDDLSPLAENNYYRLKIIDKDGTYKYSKTILIKTAENTVNVNSIVDIFPNPTSHTLNIDYHSAENSNIQLKVFNEVGQNMLNRTLNVEKGEQQFRLEVKGFAAGVYIISIQDLTSGELLQTKFVKE